MLAYELAPCGSMRVKTPPSISSKDISSWNRPRLFYQTISLMERSLNTQALLLKRLRGFISVYMLMRVQRRMSLQAFWMVQLNSLRTRNPTFFKFINVQELSGIVRKIPHDKSPGTEGILYELYSKNMYTLGTFLRWTLNTFLSEVRLLPGSQKARNVTLFKKGDVNSFGNWLPIALTNTDHNIITKVISAIMSAFSLT